MAIEVSFRTFSGTIFTKKLKGEYWEDLPPCIIFEEMYFYADYDWCRYDEGEAPLHMKNAIEN